MSWRIKRQGFPFESEYFRFRERCINTKAHLQGPRLSMQLFTVQLMQKILIPSQTEDCTILTKAFHSSIYCL